LSAELPRDIGKHARGSQAAGEGKHLGTAFAEPKPVDRARGKVDKRAGLPSEQVATLSITPVDAALGQELLPPPDGLRGY